MEEAIGKKVDYLNTVFEVIEEAYNVEGNSLTENIDVVIKRGNSDENFIYFKKDTKGLVDYNETLRELIYAIKSLRLYGYSDINLEVLGKLQDREINLTRTIFYSDSVVQREASKNILKEVREKIDTFIRVGRLF